MHHNISFFFLKKNNPHLSYVDCSHSSCSCDAQVSHLIRKRRLKSHYSCQWDNENKGQRYSIHLLQLTPESQISLRFALRLAIFKLQAILRQMHQMTLNDLKHSKVKGKPSIHIATTPESQISFSFASSI